MALCINLTIMCIPPVLYWLQSGDLLCFLHKEILENSTNKSTDALATLSIWGQILGKVLSIRVSLISWKNANSHQRDTTELDSRPTLNNLVAIFKSFHPKYYIIHPQNYFCEWHALFRSLHLRDTVNWPSTKS